MQQRRSLAFRRPCSAVPCCCTLQAVCCLSYVASRMLHVALYGVHHMLHAARYLLPLARCRLHLVRCILFVASCPLHVAPGCWFHVCTRIAPSAAWHAHARIQLACFPQLIRGPVVPAPTSSTLNRPAPVAAQARLPLVQQTTDNIQVACNMQRASGTGDRQGTACNMQHATGDLQHARCNRRLATPHAADTRRLARGDLHPRPYDRPLTPLTRHASRDVQHAPDRIKRTPCNM